MPESPRSIPPDAATPLATDGTAAQSDGFTLDLSSGPSKAKPASWKRKQKQASLVFTKVMDLSSPTPQPSPVARSVENAKPKKPTAPHAGGPKKEKMRDVPRSGGSTLADLLDAETLARLRGEDEG